MDSKIKKLLKESEKVIFECVLSNGAIVAANPKNKLYPKSAKNYFFVWVRDAAFVCLAADILGFFEISEKFFDWCLKNVGSQKNKIFLERYFVGGKPASEKIIEHPTRWKVNFQPDEAGILLYVLYKHCGGDIDKITKYSKLINFTADGLCKYWNGKNFSVITQDLWESHFAFYDLRENFTYTLAACAGGLFRAYDLLKNKKWLKTANQMKKMIYPCYFKKEKYFFRSCGKVSDKSLDTSVLGLVWPFEIFSPNDIRIQNTVKKIEKDLSRGGGIIRFLGDEYDGWMCGKIHRRKGSGFWPILNFWLAIYFAKAGDKKTAFKYYNYVVRRVDKLIPEQIFDNKYQKSPVPLCWSHAMFILASKELGII